MHADVFICILRPDIHTAFAFIANLLILITSPAILSHAQGFSCFGIEQDTEVLERIHTM
jgi:hypothetical protein